MFTGLDGAAGERALFRTVSAWGVDAVTHDLASLETGFHVVVMTFEGALTAVRMRHVVHHESDAWAGAHSIAATPSVAQRTSRTWVSSLDRAEYVDGVERIHEHIAAGTVYQVNLCRVLTRASSHDDLDVLFTNLLAHNPAPYACRIDVAGALDVVSASPELYLGREGSRISSSPIKGTAAPGVAMLAKDATENIMITDLVRNDLQRVCSAGTVEVDGLLSRESHPGLDHLVSTVRGNLREGMTWSDIFAATFPPGSVSGAPKSTALRVIDELEPVARGPYCGAIGWIDAAAERAELAVGIRTFWRDEHPNRERRNDSDGGPIMSGSIHFGAGAGITWDSSPEAEWDETQLKARRLLAVADGAVIEEM